MDIQPKRWTTNPTNSLRLYGPRYVEVNGKISSIGSRPIQAFASETRSIFSYPGIAISVQSFPITPCKQHTYTPTLSRSKLLTSRPNGYWVQKTLSGVTKIDRTSVYSPRC